jgi:hypothetical protein
MQCAASFASADFDLEAAPALKSLCPPRRLRGLLGIFRCGLPGAAAPETPYRKVVSRLGASMRARAGRCYPAGIAEPNTVRLVLVIGFIPIRPSHVIETAGVRCWLQCEVNVKRRSGW